MEQTRTFREWLRETLDAEQIEELAEHGAAGGWPGLTFYSETCALYERFEDEIWEALEQDADAFGYANALALVASFQGTAHVHGDDQLRNLLVWYLAERVAREIADEVAR